MKTKLPDRDMRVTAVRLARKIHGILDPQLAFYELGLHSVAILTLRLDDLKRGRRVAVPANADRYHSNAVGATVRPVKVINEPDPLTIDNPLHNRIGAAGRVPKHTAWDTRR